MNVEHRRRAVELRDAVEAFEEQAIIGRSERRGRRSVEEHGDVVAVHLSQPEQLMVAGEDQVDVVALIVKQLVQGEVLGDLTAESLRGQNARNAARGFRTGRQRHIDLTEAGCRAQFPQERTGVARIAVERQMIRADRIGHDQHDIATIEREPLRIRRSCLWPFQPVSEVDSRQRETVEAQIVAEKS